MFNIFKKIRDKRRARKVQKMADQMYAKMKEIWAEHERKEQLERLEKIIVGNFLYQRWVEEIKKYYNADKEFQMDWDKIMGTKAPDLTLTPEQKKYLQEALKNWEKKQNKKGKKDSDLVFYDWKKMAKKKRGKTQSGNKAAPKPEPMTERPMTEEEKTEAINKIKEQKPEMMHKGKKNKNSGRTLG